MKNYIVGLDIGTTKIACFVGERTEKGRLRIVGFGKTESIGVERGIVKNIRSTADSIRRAVSDASEMAKFDIEEVYVGIAGQHIKSRSNQGSVMIPQEHRLIEKADVDRLIEDQYRIMLDPGEEIIHVFPQCYIVDNDQLDPDIDPVGVAGKCLVANFHIVTGNTGNVHNIRDAVAEAGLKIKGVVLEPIASAYAVLSDFDKAAGVALVDIGGGTTDIAVISLGGTVESTSIKVAGDDFDEAIVRYMRKKHNLLIGDRTAEDIKIKIGCAFKTNDIKYLDVRGRNLVTGLPVTVRISSEETREALEDTTAKIVDAIHSVLEKTPPELASDIGERGIVLTGGGSLLRGLEELISDRMGINTMTAEEPMTAVAIGTGKYVEFLAGYKEDI
jgi:MreB/Mrl family cell shape determining protein